MAFWKMLWLRIRLRSWPPSPPSPTALRGAAPFALCVLALLFGAQYARAQRLGLSSGASGMLGPLAGAERRWLRRERLRRVAVLNGLLQRHLTAVAIGSAAGGTAGGGGQQHSKAVREAVLLAASRQIEASAGALANATASSPLTPESVRLHNAAAQDAEGLAQRQRRPTIESAMSHDTDDEEYQSNIWPGSPEFRSPTSATGALPDAGATDAPRSAEVASADCVELMSESSSDSGDSDSDNDAGGCVTAERLVDAALAAVRWPREDGRSWRQVFVHGAASAPDTNNRDEAATAVATEGPLLCAAVLAAAVAAADELWSVLAQRHAGRAGEGGAGEDEDAGLEREVEEAVERASEVLDGVAELLALAEVQACAALSQEKDDSREPLRRAAALLRQPLCEAESWLGARRVSSARRVIALCWRTRRHAPYVSAAAALALLCGMLDSSRLHYQAMVINATHTALSPLNKTRGDAAAKVTAAVGAVLSLRLLHALAELARDKCAEAGQAAAARALKLDLFASMLSQDVEWYERADLYEARQLLGTCDWVLTSLIEAPIAAIEAGARVATTAAILWGKSSRLTLVLLAAVAARSTLLALLDDLEERLSGGGADGVAWRPGGRFGFAFATAGTGGADRGAELSRFDPRRVLALLPFVPESVLGGILHRSSQALALLPRPYGRRGAKTAVVAAAAKEDWDWRLGRARWPPGGESASEEAEAAMAEMDGEATWNAALADGGGGLRLLRAHAREPVELEAYRRSLELGAGIRARGTGAWRLLAPLKDACDEMLEVIALWYGGKVILEAGTALGSAKAVVAGAAAPLPLLPGDLVGFASMANAASEQLRFTVASLTALGGSAVAPAGKILRLIEQRPRIGLVVAQSTTLSRRTTAADDPPEQLLGDEMLATGTQLSAAPLPTSIPWTLGFDRVEFAYPSRPTARVLRGLSFEVGAGTVVGVMGPTGAGKSTLFALIQRFFDPLAGRLTLGGRDLRGFEPLWLRRHLAVVEQEPVLLNRSVKDNLLYGCVPPALRGAVLGCTDGEGESESGDVIEAKGSNWQPPSDAELEDALRAANCHHTFFGGSAGTRGGDGGAQASSSASARFPEGWHTLVGEGGCKLSGGERQRVAIARALLKVPDTHAPASTANRFLAGACCPLQCSHSSFLVAILLSPICPAR
jgi:ABC-type multidrug transport system fused ATPase/permease subunit